MDVIFLDIDGVLNSDRYYEKLRSGASMQPVDDTNQLDANAVRILNGLVAASGAEVVLASDWRKDEPGPGLLQTERLLIDRGAEFTLLGATPVLSETERAQLFGATWKGSYTPRGLEIQRWLDLHPMAERFAILDDEPGMEHLTEFLVQTDRRFGLTEQNASDVLALLATQKNT